MNALWLFLIVPLSFYAGFIMAAIFATSKDDKED